MHSAVDYVRFLQNIEKSSYANFTTERASGMANPLTLFFSKETQEARLSEEERSLSALFLRRSDS